MLVMEKRTVILGDACNLRVFLFKEEASSVEEYYKAFVNFQNKYADCYDQILMSHGPAKADIRLLPDIVATGYDILTGRWKNREYSL